MLAMPRYLLTVGLVAALVAPTEAFTSGSPSTHPLSSSALFPESDDGRADYADGGTSSDDAPSGGNSGGTITAELLMDDESLRAKEIAESFAQAKAAATGGSTAVPVTSDDIGITMVMDKAKRDLDELKFQVGRVDEDRVREIEKREAEINRLKFSLAEVREQAEESTRKALEAEGQIAALETQVEDGKEESKGLIARIKEKFKKEKVELTTKVNDMTEELESTKAEAEKEVSDIKLAYMVREKELENQLSDIQSKFSASETKVGRLITEDAEEMRSHHRDQLNRQKKEARRLQEASDRIAAQDKRDLRNKAWALETALSAAKYDLMLAQKQINRLLKDQKRMEAKMVEMQNEMKLEIASAVEALGKDKVQLKKETIEAMAGSKTEKYEALRAAGIKYDALVVLNEERVREAQEAAEATVRFARQEASVRMSDNEKKLNRERIVMKEQNEIDIIKAKAEAFQEVKRTQEILRGVEDDLQQKEVLVATLEGERKSFRKIIRMALKLARERTSNAVKKVTGRREK